jgi:hypothetical protein
MRRLAAAKAIADEHPDTNAQNSHFSPFRHASVRPEQDGRIAPEGDGSLRTWCEKLCSTGE